MHRRRIQLIAGATYSVSLPKEWVKKNRLKPKQEVQITENVDGSLLITPHASESTEWTDVTLNVDRYLDSIEQIIFAVYYQGAENINLYSKEKMSKEIKSRIRKANTQMIGTEVTHEDSKRIHIKILLDKRKVDVIQTFYRISILIDSSLANLKEGLDIDEIRINENEIDRLYHLITKIIALSLTDTNILHSSKIENISLIPSYFLMAKRLENIGDNIKHMSEYLHESQKQMSFQMLRPIQDELIRCIKYLRSKNKEIFPKICPVLLDKITKSIDTVKDRIVYSYLDDILRYLIDIQVEIIKMSFYNQASRKGRA
ncbi:MAG: AbrB/MazE/SpoVT family DNA-binding domain-containing protein [Nanoarchaeota archaeon]|nr:AbrB/MazE/SpoVT family DNA-binding domain-containing protein [Nanoarchaeota archaeon]